MDVRASSFELALADIASRLGTAVFVAVDLELTGVNAGSESYADLAQERLEKGCRIVESYAPIQLGITICSGERHLASYSIMMAPESTFLCDIAALKFLRQHKVDLNLWVDEGVRFISREEAESPLATCQGDQLTPMLQLHRQAHGASALCDAAQLRAERRAGVDLNAWVDAQDSKLWRPQDTDRFTASSGSHPGHEEPQERRARNQGLPRLWHLLKQARRPFIVHCGFMDVLFLLAAFERHVLPRDPKRLAMLVQECFPAGIYDTALLHETISDLRMCPQGLHGFVKNVRERYRQRHHGEDLSFELEWRTAERYAAGLQSENEELTHEAGFDSLLTALLSCYVQEEHQKHWTLGRNRFYLHKSTDCLNLGMAAAGRGLAMKVYDCDKLVVAELKNRDAQENTARRISEARRNDRELSFFYRKMDDSYLLIPGCNEPKLVQLSQRLPGVEWRDFYTWQKTARSRMVDGERRFTGFIKSFSATTRYGFINSPDACRIYDTNNDVYLQQTQAVGFRIGQYVSFLVSCNQRGQPQARDLEEVWFTGVIRGTDSMNPHTLWISSPGAFRAFSCDIRMHDSHGTELRVGDNVCFSIIMVQGQPEIDRTRPTPLSQPGSQTLEYLIWGS